MPQRGHIAFDLGAESGRAMLAQFDGHQLQLAEVHRFANVPQQLPSGIHWNLQDLWTNILRGLQKGLDAAAKQDIEVASIGVDTWGVDFALIGRSGQLLGLPFTYRDERTTSAYTKTLAALDATTIYEMTGIQFMPINTLYQLVAQHEAEPSLLERADRLLMIGDLLHYFLTGEAVNEATNASTTQMIDPRTGKWAIELLQQLNVPTAMLGPIVAAGTKIGPTRRGVVDRRTPLQVVAPATHDTGSAVAAVPASAAKNETWAYLSSGTWSLMGVELDEPVITAQSQELSLTNERGAENKIRFLKNIAGLWLVQECRRDFLRHGQDYSYGQLTQMATDSEPFRTLVNPDDPTFAAPGDMAQKIVAFATRTHQPKPQSPGQFVRCCLESLALAYRQTLLALEQVLAKRIERLHIVGGGGQNRLLNQMTASALNREVVVGPFEATAIGNALTQALGLGQVAGLADIRAVVTQSFPLETYEPQQPEAFEQQCSRYEQLLAAPE